MKPHSQDSFSASSRRFGEGPLSGAAVIMIAKLLSLCVSLASLAVLGRILSPTDYGIVSMVTSITAFMTVFSDLGLSLVTVQRKELHEDQASTLFWINVAFGFVLFVFSAALAPALVWFYQDPQLLTVTIAIGTVFPLMSLGIQHQALLKREMKFRHLAAVRLVGTVTGCSVAVTAAWQGLGFWALVLQPIASASVETLATFVARPWRPSRPRTCQGIGGMLNFGGNLTAHGMVGYFSNNLDNVLLGRTWGSHELGLYAACYSLMMRPIVLAGYSIGETAIPALCREASAPDRQRAVYRRMLTVTALIGMPVCLGGTLCAPDVVRVLLGPQWSSAASVLALLLLAAIPRLVWTSTGWIYVSTGRPERMFQWQLLLTPVVILAFLLGLPYGAFGIASAYALINWVAVTPAFAFCLRDTKFRSTDVLQPLIAPSMCAVLSCLSGLAVQSVLFPHLDVGAGRLGIRVLVTGIVYAVSVFVFVPLVSDAVRKIMARMSVSPSQSVA